MEKMEVFEVIKVTEEVESPYNSSHMEVTPPKKRKSKSQEDSVEKPKKPRSAYLLYYFDVHQIMQQEIPNLPQSEINKQISESWKRLSVAEKGYYLEKAKLEKEGNDGSSCSPSKDLPGFRKILPRANYYLLAKGCSSNQPRRSQPEVSVVSLDAQMDGGLSSVSFAQEGDVQPLGLAGEVELSEQSVISDDLGDSPTLRGVPPASSSSTSPKITASADAPVSQTSADHLAAKGNEINIAESVYCGATVQQIQGEATQMIAFIPSQNLLESNSLASVSSVGPLMMVSVGAGEEQSTAPSYKMSVKTYTRRGRGRCLNPGCSFVYVTRHKPPTCPECGSHLGGKWIPVAKKTQEKETISKQPADRAKAASNESCQPASPGSLKGNADGDLTNSAGSKKAGHGQRCLKKRRAVPRQKPAEGGGTQPQEQTNKQKDSAKGIVCQSQGTALKRPVRPILPAYYSTGRTLFQIITAPPVKGKFPTPSNDKSSTVPQESFSGLKPSTLKQLGQAVTATATAAKQDCSLSSYGNPPVTSLTNRMNIVSVVPFKQCAISSFDLGLSTARGRGRCKNPLCDYMYKNRHKPTACPKCGCELNQTNTKGKKSGTLLDPYQPLSPVQKDLQRQSTLQLLRSSLQIPESEAELQETLALIQELNSLQIVLVQPGEQDQEEIVESEGLVESGWPQFYESAATQCGLCNSPLFKGGQSTVAGQEDCWLLTETLIQTASLQLKVCLNVQCLALHSFTDLHPGLFNIGNRLLVSIDLLLKIRTSIKSGRPPSEVVRTILDHVPNHPVHALSPEESCQIQEFLLSGYWAFECLTVRDYNDMICGVCGVAPKMEISRRHADNVLELKNVEFTWPEFSISDEVHVDDFWLTMENEAIEQALFPTDIPITRVDASIIAPFIPPLMRSSTVINTEKDKVPSQVERHKGDPSVLVRLIHDGQLKLDKMEEHGEDELRAVLERCGETVDPGCTKNDLLASLISLCTHVHSGLATAPPPLQHLTAGKLSKVCPHKVVCGSKCLVRGETARDHVDLLLSSRYWPPVYVSDCARQVALCADMQYPDLAAQKWGRNQACFSDPFEKPEFVSCLELQDRTHNADLTASGENPQVHPVTRSSACWLVNPPGAGRPDRPAPLDHHSMELCRDLDSYAGSVADVLGETAELEDEGRDKRAGEPDEKRRRKRRPVVFNNTAYYYLYNRLVDFLSSRDIVNQQISQVVKACQPGEVVIRDALYRLGVAQINAETAEDEVSEMEGRTEDLEAAYEVVLPE